jgi:hypothetical protein
MRAISLVLYCLLVTSECASRKPEEVVFLTREGCIQTDQMRANLDAQVGSERMTYRVVDLASLAPDDPSRGYPTPTLLYNNHDLFGMPTPAPPVPGPT